MARWDGSRLGKAREEKLWTRDDLADAWSKRYRHKLSLVSISNWERGVKPPGRNNLIKLAALLEKSVEYFFTTSAQTKKNPRHKKRAKKRFIVF